jgi:DNA polymerase III epsilon subunit-like protein
MWMHRDTVISDCITPARVKRQDDREVLKPLYDLMDEADYIVGHNMRPFDWKMVSARFFIHGWKAPHDARIIDTLALSRKRFKTISHSLDAWLKRKNIGGKDDMEREDWERCIRGDKSALDKMVKYCRNDVKRGAQLTKDFQRYVEQATGQLLFK